MSLGERLPSPMDAQTALVADIPPDIDPGIEALRRGFTLASVARCLGISRQTVANWRQVPANRVRQVAALTGIPPHQLRPDMYYQPNLDDQPDVYDSPASDELEPPPSTNYEGR